MYKCINYNDHEIKINNTTKNNYQLLALGNILPNIEENHVEVYPVDLEQVESLQRRDKTFRKIMANYPNRNYKRKKFEQRSIIFYKNMIYIPEPLRITSIRRYHHYLCHPGKTCMYKKLSNTLY